MGKRYEVVPPPGSDSVTVLHPLNPVLDRPGGEVVDVDHYSETHLQGDVIKEEDLSPYVLMALENEDPHTCSILVETTKTRAEFFKERGIEVTEEDIAADAEPFNPLTGQHERLAAIKAEQEAARQAADGAAVAPAPVASAPAPAAKLAAGGGK